ncbi:uncharacterized protein B0I36DRAFT_358019 [Microdochium trichocladiopsis]|uniref:Uncharacterized protein n=1 Tax=Microdochium trichocladiopsis TaxID=1682393 RepID=A0A9P9BVX2_9PEZI|nr:uncharacterized protein B0I36DRAFT_358019 [Microdochium trichocladiopsis]KAH7040753.1 hypothetical protein B0I36DRAFT_358019 [Microdochium trichocladiopsis]
MDVSSSTTARLRRTFAYPDDATTSTDDDDSREALDEQEQEDLILTLAEQNEARNAQFTTALLALPVLATLPYLVVLLVRGSTLSDRLIALLSLSSLGSTAYMLRTQAPGVTGIWHIDAWTAGVYSLSSPTTTTATTTTTTSQPSSSAVFDPRDNNSNSAATTSSATGLGPDYAAMGGLGSAARRKRRRSSASSFGVWFPAQRTPLELYLPYLNVGLCLVLVLMSAAKAWASGGGGNGGGSSSPSSSMSWGDFGLGNLPAIVYAVVLVSKVVMGSVDPEKELSALRYQYKGA